MRSTLTFEDGEVDVAASRGVTVETNHNKTIDVLPISAEASVELGNSFETEGPEGTYELDLLFDFALNAGVASTSATGRAGP